MTMAIRRHRPRGTAAARVTGNQPREMCFHCQRPATVCHCQLIPEISNQTRILIAQHIRERDHPFNTARMVRQSLTNVQLIFDYSENFHRHSNLIGPGTALLYPSKSAIDIADVLPQNRPQQLILLDGTWSQVRRLYRHWRALSGLPHYRIAPLTPGQYRIRLEPDEHALSTVEATVAALRVFEPQTAGLDRLLQAFGTMVERQLSHPNAEYARSRQPREQKINTPYNLLRRFRNVVVAYGEAGPDPGPGKQPDSRQPVYWVAKRIASDERFSTAIQSRAPLTDQMLRYFELDRQQFDGALDPHQFRDAWRTFLRPHDILTVYNAGTLRLLDSLDLPTRQTIVLRSVNYDPDAKRTLKQFFEAKALVGDAPDFPGRAGRRLARLSTLCRYLLQQHRAPNTPG